MKKAGIFSRLMLGYLLLLVLATGMSVYFILQLERVHGVTQTVMFEDNALLDLHKNLAAALQSEVRYEKQFIALSDQASYDGFLLAWRDFERDLGKAVEISRSPGMTAELDRIRTLHAGYQILFEEEAALRRSGTLYTAARYRAMKQEVTRSLDDALQALRSGVQQNIIYRVRKLNQAVMLSNNIVMAVTGASLVLGIVLALVITRSITVPLARIRERTAEIGSGVYDASLLLTSPPEVAALATDINRMSARLKEVDRMKSDFYALMSHELRTPLTSIREGTNLLIDGTGGPVTERQRRILTILGEESDRLIGLVSSLLDLSRMEAGMQGYQFAPADLPGLIEQVVTEVAPLAEARRIRIERDLPAVPPVVLDAERILQVLRNLVGNALKFTPAGGAVRVSLQRRPEGARVSVSDTGPGIPRDRLSDVFDKFQRVPPAAGRGAAAGTGLGLAIVRHIVEDHGGWVWAESGNGAGSTFSFVLPEGRAGGTA